MTTHHPDFYMSTIKYLFIVLLAFPSILMAQKGEKKDPINKTLAAAEKVEGFFTFYNAGDKLYLAIRPEQIDMDFLLNYQIDRGIGASGLYGGTMLGGFESDVVSF